MADSSENPQLSKYLQSIIRDLQNTAKLMSSVTEKLSKSGIDKFTDQLKEQLKSNKLLNDADLKHIKDLKTLHTVLQELEDDYSKILKLEEMRDKQREKLLKKEKYSQAAAEKMANVFLDGKREEIGMSKEMFNALKDGVPNLRKYILSQEKTLTVNDKFRKNLEEFSDHLKDNVSKFASVSTALGYFKKSLTLSYEQMIRLTNRGLLGAFATINVAAPKLLLTAQEFEDIINKNRDLINNMGGGIKGINELADEVGRVRKGLEYLGKDATKAAARFVELSKNAGLTTKDGITYQKNLNSSIKQFKEFNGLFGDSFEDYSDLMQAQQEEEIVRRRLNTLNKDQLRLELDEIRKRTENLKLMGLSNTQIIEFNRKIQSLIDPRQVNFSERAAQGQYLKSTVIEVQRLLGTSTNPEDRQSLADLQQNQQSLMRIADLFQQGRQRELSEFMQSSQGAQAARTFNKSLSRTDLFDQYARANVGYMFQGTGQLGSILEQSGGALATAQTQKRAISDNVDQLNKLKTSSKDLVAETSNLATAFKGSTTVVEGINVLLSGAFGAAITTATAALGAFIKSTLTAAAVNRMSSGGGFGGDIGKIGKSAGKGKWLKRLGKGGAILGAGIAGYEAYDAYKEYQKGNISESQRNSQYGGAAGGALGAWGGGEAGATVGAGIGSLFGGIGAAPGAIIGAILGAIAGAWGGSSLGSSLGSKFGRTGKSIGSNVVSGKIKNNNATPNSSMNINFKSYADALAKRESSGNSSIVNKFGYLGKYQMGVGALIDAGLVKPGTPTMNNNVLNNPSVWLNGLSKKEFLSNESLQDKAFKAYTLKNYSYLLSNGTLKPGDPPEKIAGALAAAHLKGPGAAKMLVNRGVDSSDAFGTSALSYMNLGAVSQRGINTNPVTGLNNETISNTSSSGTISSVPTISSIPSSIPTDEIKKQTLLLEMIAKNTTGNSRIQVRDDAYQLDTATVLNGY